MNIPTGFSNLGIDPKILDILTKLGFITPTPIQAKAIPVLVTGQDIIGIAQTGTGKTLAFGVPLIQSARPGTQKLIVLPTRELALQVQEVLVKIAKPLGIHSTVIIGGESMQKQIQEIRRQPQIIIGTPGRIVDHLQQRTLRLDRVTAVVLDEADRMLDMGFAPQLRKIMDVLPAKRQTMLFSATMPEDIVRIARTYMQLPIRVEIAQPGTPAEHITQEVFFVDKPNKALLLEKMLVQYPGSVLLFSRTKHGARKIAAMIRRWGHASAEIHANRTLAQRKEALQGFKTGKYRILVATDIAARGIDVKDISLVLNYDLPDNPSDYVHRIGRTGRAGESGHAITFATPEQRRDVEGIEKLIRAVLPRKAHPDLPPIVMPAAPVAGASRSAGRRPPRRWNGGRRPGRR
ncbi:MAG: DEAD/DEAH box helicase [Patescibacteria group bacterium]